MLFSSFVFVFGFLPIALAGFYLAARVGRVAASIWLVGASFVFYGWWNPGFVVLLLISISVNYTVSIAIGRLASRPAAQTWVTAGGIAFNLGALVYYKYLASLSQFLHGLLGGVPALDPIVLPLGISFFSFTQIAYLVDCKTGLAKERGLLNYVLFVTFYPHLIAGPILHNRDIMPQFARPETYRFSLDNLTVGLTFFVLGLLKKVALADPLSHWVTEGYADPSHLPWVESWNLALCYSLQLYFDFSGYSDMAIGLARMMNVRFPVNFDSPYKSQCVIDYWQRWHITLTKFLTVYLYTPLALRIMRWRTSRKLKINRAAQQTVGGFASMIAAPLLVTMGLAGVWHGSGLTFLIFGLLHALYLTVNHFWRLLRPGLRSQTPVAIAGRVGLTYLCVLVGSVFFRAPSVEKAVQVLAGMAGAHGLGATSLPAQIHAVGGGSHILWMAFLYAIVWLLPNTQQIMHKTDPVIGRVEPPRFNFLVWRPGIPSSLAIGTGAAMAVIALGGTAEFLYFQF